MDIFNNLETTNQDDEKKKRLQQQIDARKNKQYENNPDQLQMDPANNQEYQVEIDPIAFANYNRNVIANSENPEEEKNRFLCATEIAKELGKPVTEVMDNLDDYINALYSKQDARLTPENSPFPTYRNAFVAIKDNYILGKNTLKQGEIGNKLMQAELDGDEGYAKRLLEEYNTYEEDNKLRQDNAKRSWITDMFKVAANSVPFTVNTGAAGLAGSLISPAAGNAAGFLYSQNITNGQVYAELRNKGVTPSTARKVAALSGSIQAAIEVGLGTVSETLAAGSRIAGTGTKAAAALVKGSDIIEKVTYDNLTGKLANTLTEVGKKAFHYGTGTQAVVNWLLRYSFNTAGEGIEELSQSITEDLMENWAYSLDKLNVPKHEADEIIAKAAESFKGGIQGALILGAVPSAINAKATAQNYQDMRKAATDIESEAMFMAEQSDNPVVSELNDVQKYQYLHDVFEEAQADKNAAETKTAEEIAEVNKIEGNEPAPVDENGDPIDTPAYREEGKIYTTDNVISVDGQKSTNEYIVGDPSKESENSYGSIQYEMDEDNQTVTITSFDMAPHRENLRNEVFDKFAQEHSNFDIKWETTGARAEEIKNNLIALNPSGKNNGLNYYSSEEQNIEARKEIDSQVKQFMPKITDEQRPFVVSFMESLARKTPGRDINNFLNTVFQNRQIFGDIKEGEQIANKEGYSLIGNPSYKESNGMTTNVRFTKDIKKVIYAGEHGDFTTFCHELIHAAQPFFDQETEAEAERLFNVQNGDWNNSTYNYVDPNGIERTITSAEALTYAAEDYFNTGYVQNEEARTLMQKIAKIFVDLYDACKRHLTLTPEIRAFYDKLFNADNSVLAAAEKSLQQEIKEEQDQTVNQDEELLNNQREATELYFKDRANLGYSREEALRELENNEMNKANLYYQNKEIVQEMADKYFPDNSISQEEIDALLDGINIDQFEQTEEDIRDNIENFKADEALNQDLKNILADSSLTPEQQQEYFDKITDPNATLTDQERAVLEAAGIDANNIRYDALMQSKENKENPELWQKKIKTAENYLTTDYYSEKDILRISKNLKIFKDSAWYNQAIETLLLRGDIEDLVNEREAKGLSLLYRDDMKTQLEACKQGVEGIAAYLESTGIIGSNDKCVHSVNGSFINCNPSKLCAEFCYAANGSFTWPAPSVKSELVSWYIDKNPIAAAQMVAKHYKTRKETRLEFTSGKALRLLDKGELSENWIQFVKELNHNDIHTTIFSKRPELLRQIDSHYNVIMISSDWTNRAIAMREENLNLPMAYVYQGLDGEIEYLEANKERYLKYGGSILPVRDKNKNEGAKYIDKLPEWTKDYLCPIDSGEVTTKEHDCLICNSAGGIGCYYHRVTIAEKYIDDSPLDTWEKEKLHASIRTIESQVDEAVRRGESEELEILLSSMANLVNKIQSGLIERDYSERVKRDGEFPQRTSRASEGIGSGESKPNFQAIGELGATTLDRLQEVNTRIDNLDVAKKMETSGKDPLAVKIATGWERGADGKWRYEIPDLELADYDTIYKNIIGYPGIQKKAISLKNIIKADELFKAYPDLKDIDVLFDSDIEKGTAGQWESDRNIIRMKYDYLEEISKDAVNIIEDDETGEEEIEDLRNPQYIKSTLIHEIQHAIQDREGFARGGSPSEFESFMSKEEVENFKSILKQEGAQKQKKAAELLMQINKDINTDKLLKDYMSEIQAGKATLDQYFDELVKRQKSHQLWNEYNTLSQDADKSLQKAQRLGMYETNEGEIITPFEAYRRLAGEVEARNVQYRQYLTDEQRRNRLLEQTEDVSRDQQIVLYNAMKMASMDADPVEMEKIAIRRQYEGTENWLKAPNGENTNLTEKQWIEVRTSNFKNFFGDWQNDPENASKVLDENGEPLVVYHGTDKDFDVFDATKSRANMDIQGNFFSPWNIDAQGYGPNVRAFYLNIKNPAKEQVGYKALHTFTGQNEAGIKARELLKQQGYDGVNNSDEEYITFNANQIKSATDNNGNFDVNNPSVLMQESDAEYLDAVRLGDLVKAQQMVDQKAAEALAAGATMTIINDDEAIAYKIHRKRDPYGAFKVEKGKHITLEDVEAHNKKFRDAVEWNKNHPDQPVKVPTFFVYKTLGFSETGGAHATYAGTQDEMPWLTWLDAQAIKAYQSPINGNYYIPGDTGMDAKALGLPKEVSQKWLSFRPAFHAGANAYPGQMRVSIQSGVDEYNKGRAKEDRLPIPEVKDKPGNYRWMLHNKLIALVEVPGEINYQQEAETYAKVMAEEAEKWYDAHPEAKRPSKFDRRAQLAYTPDMGYYEYMNQKEPWVLTGQWKMHRVLTEAEIRQVNEASGVYNEGKTTLNWIGGYKPEEYGFTADGDKIEVRPTKLADAVTYDEEGNVIPLSQRFNVNNPSPLFQTEDELYRDARNYASWEDFMDAYTSDFDPDAFMDPEYHSQVPSQADAAWYKKVWQFAQQRKEESFNQQEQRDTKIKTDDQDAVDKQFYSDLIADPTMLNHFLHNVGLVKAQDFNSEAYANPESEEEYNEIQELAALQSYMNIKLSNPLWTTNAQRVAKGISITPTSRQQLLTMIRGSERAYREIYSRVMQDDTYAVPEEQSIVKNLEKKAKKYKLISKNDDLETRSPEELRKLADEISNREIADEIRSGQLKLDDRLDKYINSLTTQVTDQQKKMDDLKKTIDDDYQRISDWESRQLLKVYDEMLETRLKYNNNTDLMSEKLRKGLIITSKYQLDNRKLKATYDEVFKKFKDLEKSMQINAETREALNRREEYFFLKEAVARKQREANAAREVKKIRVQLVKRVMRKVPLDRVDYDTARTIIAIQKVFEPNLLGGVNKWIGQEKPYLVTVATAWLTDEEEKQRLTRYLSNGGKAAHQLLAKLETLQKVEDLNEWTAKELQSALRVLPKENWIKDLHLDELAEQRDEDINLGITQDFNYKWVYLPNNDSEYNTSIKAQIKEWHAVFPKDVEQMIKDAIGDILYNDLINKPMAEWSTEEMTLLAQKVNDLYKMGRDVLAAKKQAQIEAADAIRQQIEKALNDTGITIKDDDSDEVKAAKQKKIDDILGNNAALKGTLNDEGESRINRLLHGYADANIRRVTRIMDNYQEGINTNELYWKEDAAYTEEVNQKRARSEKINEALKKYNIGFNELYEKHTIENFYKGESITLTTDELLYFAKAAEDEQSKEAVMYGNMFSAANMQKYKERFLTMDELAAESEYQPNEDGQAYGPGTMMFMDVCGELFTRVLEEAEKLDKKFYQFADAIAADYEEQYVRLNKASIEQFNQPVRRVEKYVPLIRLESNGDTNENKVMQDCLAINGLGKQWVDKGMTQKRITMSPLYQKPVQTGLYKTWLDSVDRTEHFIAYSPLVRELNRVYKSRDAQFTRQFIQNRYGKGMLSYIDEYINELANPTANRVRSASDEFFKTLRGRTAPAYLSWKLSSIIKQGLTSPWPYMQFVDPAHYIAAVFKNIGTKGAIFDLIKEKSPYMRERVMDPMNDLVREMEQQAKNPFTAAYFKASATGMAGLEWIDWVCVAPGWYACYQKEYNRLQNENAKLYQDEKTRLLKANEEADFDNQLSQQQIEAAATAKQLNEAQIEKYAVRYADDVTRQCQPSNRSVDIAPLFKNSSEFAKAYLQFQTSLNVIWQNLRYDIPAAAKNKDFMRITGMVMGYVFAGILMNAVVGGVGDGDDKEKKDEVKDLIWYATTQFTDSVPMIGSELTNMMEKLITGKGSFIGNTDMTPLVTKATRAIQNTAAAIKADPEDKNQAWFKAARSYADAAEMYFGAPVQGIKEIKKLVGVGDGDGKMDISLDNVADVYGIVNNIKPKDK